MKKVTAKPRNFVAKHNKNRAVVMRDRTQYQRRTKHREQYATQEQVK